MDVTIKKNQGFNKGFTLIEILVVIGIIAILAAVVLIAINPARQFAQARNSQRVSNVNSILNAIGQNIADNKGIFKCSEVSNTIPTAVTVIAESTFDVRPCIRPTYMSEIPIDPKNGINECTDDACTGSPTYDTKYTIQRDVNSQRIKVCAPESLLETAISTPGPTVCIER